MGKRPEVTPWYDLRDLGKFKASSVHPVEAEPCPQGCGYPDSGKHDCPAGPQTFDDWVGEFASTPVGPMAKQVASNNGMPPYLRFKQAMENAGLSAAAYRNTSEVDMLRAASHDLMDAVAALADMAVEKGHAL